MFLSNHVYSYDDLEYCMFNKELYSSNVDFKNIQVFI